MFKKDKVIPSIALGVSLLGFAELGFATDAAQEAYRLGDYIKASETLKSNDPVSQYYLGKLRLYGYGLLKNNPLALQYFTAAANRGYLPAEQLLARYMLIGENNPEAALGWFKKAANQGDNQARMYCAAAYLLGYGTHKNPDAARKYYIDAAKDGVPLAQFTLGEYFIHDRHANNDYLGRIWLSKAAESGNAQALDALGVIAFNGKKGRDRDPEEALSLFQKSASKGYKHAMIHLSQVALAQKEYDKALSWIEKANKPKNDEAQLALAQLYMTPDTPFYKPNEALDIARQLATRKGSESEKAALLLAKAYEEGLGVNQDKTAASDWKAKAKAAERVNPAIDLKGVMSWLTEGKTEDVEQSVYALRGIFHDWNNSNALSNQRYNMPPQMPHVSKSEIFKPQFEMINPSQIAMSDYFEHIANYGSTKLPGLNGYAQYPLYPTFELLKYHDSKVLNHETDTAFIYPETLLDQMSDEPDTMVLLGLVPKDQNRRLNYQKALYDLYGRAILSDAAAQFELGQLYQAGIGVAQSAEQAINYYQLAAMQQEVRAEYNLGLMYLRGQTNPVDYEQGIDWLMDAAFKGNPYAQYTLGNLYQTGFKDPIKGEIIVDKNLDQSIAMYYLATSNGYAPAEYQLASLLLRQNQSNLNLQARKKKETFIKSLYQDASDQGVASALLPLAFYQAMSQDQEEQKAAFKTAYKQANNGNTMAALLLAMLYDRGVGVEQSHDDAVSWYSKAVNNPIAAFILGTYASQEGKKVDKNAQSLLSFAADQDLAYANYNLAILNHQRQQAFLPYLIKAQRAGNPTAGVLLADYYLKEAKTDENMKVAQQIYLDFAQRGDPQAATKLAYLYEHGIGTTANAEAAQKWYHLAAEQNLPLAQYLLGELYQSGKVDGKSNILQAKKWYQKATLNGSPYAPMALGFVEEIYVQNYKEASKNYEKAGESQAIALYNLGLIKEYGKGEPVAFDEAFSLYQKSANLDNTAAMVQLGRLYLKGLGTSKDTSQAEKWLKKAADRGNREALYELGQMAFEGINQSKNLAKAAEYFEKASALGQEQASVQLAHMLKDGNGIAKDEARAIELYTKAAKNANADAAVELARISFKQGQVQQAQKWLEQAQRAGHPKAKTLSDWMKNTTQPRTSAIPASLPETKGRQVSAKR